MEKKLLTIFGASGLVGSSILRAALDRGYHVNGTVRNVEDQDRIARLKNLPSGKNTNFFSADMADIYSLDNPLKNAPHTHVELSSNKWEHMYEREEAAYPSEILKTVKYWPPVGRVDNVYGDKNLFCTCPSMDEYEGSAA